MYKNIDKTALFKGLEIKEINNLLEGKEFFTRKFYKNNYIAYRNEETKYVIIILKGKIQTMLSNSEGKVKKIIILPKYSSIAPAFLFGENNKFPVDVKSVDESLILYIAKSSLLQIVQENEIVLNNYLNILSTKAQVLSEKLWKGFSNNTIKKKIKNYLIENLNKDTMIITFDKTLEDLAKYFDVSRPSLSRALSEFIKNGSIEKLERGKYLVKNFDALG
jgi:CRP-like cAMP-binding protein